MDNAVLGQKPVFAVLLLHGLCGPADELKPIAVRIQKQFGKAALIMQPPCRARLKSAIRPIDQQAFDVYKHIERESMNYGKALSSLPLIIIGYSQGGLLACILGKSYKDRLNIVGIVTLNAPLVGTPLLERRRKDLQTFISHAEQGLTRIAYPLYRVKWSMALQGWIWMFTRLRWMPLDGLKDMLPSSACIENVYNFLQDNADIPCLLIATHQNDFAELFHINIQTSQHYREIEALNDAYALLITGKKDGRHDTLIPLSSQLGKKDYLNNQIPIDTKYTIHRSPSIEGAKKVQIKQRIYKGILHASNLVAIDPRLFVDRGEKVLCADAVLTDVMQFIDATIAPF